MKVCPTCKWENEENASKCNYCSQKLLSTKLIQDESVVTVIKNADNQTVVAIPYWMWLLGGLSTAFGIVFVIILWLSGWNQPLAFFALTGGMLFVGIFFFCGLTTKVTFDTILGNITIRQYIWLWPYRTRHIPKKEVQYTTTASDEPSVVGVPGIIAASSYEVLIKVAGRKKTIKIVCLSMGRANYLADRIKAFIRLD